MEKQNENDFNKLPSDVAKVYDVVNEIAKQLAEIKKSFEPKKPTEYLSPPCTMCLRSTEPPLLQTPCYLQFFFPSSYTNCRVFNFAFVKGNQSFVFDDVLLLNFSFKCKPL